MGLLGLFDTTSSGDGSNLLAYASSLFETPEHERAENASFSSNNLSDSRKILDQLFDDDE